MVKHRNAGSIGMIIEIVPSEVANLISKDHPEGAQEIMVRFPFDFLRRKRPRRLAFVGNINDDFEGCHPPLSSAMPLDGGKDFPVT